MFSWAQARDHCISLLVFKFGSLVSWYVLPRSRELYTFRTEGLAHINIISSYYCNLRVLLQPQLVDACQIVGSVTSFIIGEVCAVTDKVSLAAMSLPN